jgi:predicted TIM-barrel fold metal-dependent hydrolase
MSETKIISSDSHVFEPRELWTTRLEPKYRDRAPQIVRLDDGADWWFCDGLKLFSVQPGAQPGRRFDDPENLSRVDVYENVRLGGYIPEEHVKDMDIDGIELSVVYPTIGLLLFGVPDGGLLSAIFKTYNDWVVEFCQPFPDKIKAIGVVNLDDVQEGVKELERCAKMGLVGAMITTYPPEGRSFVSEEYEPFWSAAEDLGMPLSLHAATNRALIFNATHTRMSYLVNMDYWIRMSLSDMCLSGVFERHPKLQIGAVEYELSWIPHFLERLDYGYTQRPKASTQFQMKKGVVPSDYIRQNVFFGFQEDAQGIRDRHIIGVDNLVWGSDYPHQESTFPYSQKVLKEILADCTEEEAAKIYNKNGARIYNLN